MRSEDVTNQNDQARQRRASNASRQRARRARLRAGIVAAPRIWLTAADIEALRAVDAVEGDDYAAAVRAVIRVLPELLQAQAAVTAAVTMFRTFARRYARLSLENKAKVIGGAPSNECHNVTRKSREKLAEYTRPAIIKAERQS